MRKLFYRMIVLFIAAGLAGSSCTKKFPESNWFYFYLLDSLTNSSISLTVTPADTQNILSWSAVSGASSYKIYWNTTGSPTTASTQITAASSPYVHSGLINGQIYYYIITSVVSGNESSPSAVASATPNPVITIPPAPAGLTVSPGNAQNSISWSPVSGAVSYDMYWSNTSGTGTGGTLLSGVSSPFTHTGLTNGSTYYYVIVSVNGAGSSPASPEASGTPQIPPPAAPASLSAAAGDSTVALTWTPSPTATSYNIYRNVNGGALSLLGSVASSPYSDNTAVNGNTYNYVVVAVNAGGSSGNSSPASATPQVTAPGAPTITLASPGDAQVQIAWTGTGTTYNLYWTTGASAVTTSSNKITGVTSTYTHTLLTNGTQYNYALTAVTGGVEGALSTTQSVTPQITAPAAPASPAATAGTNQNTISWLPSLTAVTYNIYWSTVSGTGTGGTLISGVNSPYIHTGLTNGSAYYYVVTAVNAGGQSSPSLEVSATPVPLPPLDPKGLTAVPGNTTVSLSWTAPAGAVSYNVYRNVNGGAASLIATVAAPTVTYLNTGLTNGTLYNYIVTAVNAGGEGSTSNVASAVPQVPPPGAVTGVAAVPDFLKNTLSWTNDPSATSYNIYWNVTGAAVTTADFKITNVSSGYVHTPILGGVTYYYKIASVNAGGEVLGTQFSSMPLSCRNYYVIDDADFTGSYGSATTTYANAGAYGGLFRGQAIDSAGNTYTVNDMCPGTYYVWVHAFDTGGWTDKSYGYWDYNSAVDNTTNADWYAFDTFGWLRSNAVSLTAGTHVWQFGAMADGNWYTVGWDQFVITQDPGYTPSGIVNP